MAQERLEVAQERFEGRQERFEGPAAWIVSLSTRSPVTFDVRQLMRRHL